MRDWNLRPLYTMQMHATWLRYTPTGVSSLTGGSPNRMADGCNSFLSGDADCFFIVQTKMRLGPGQQFWHNRRPQRASHVGGCRLWRGRRPVPIEHDLPSSICRHQPTRGAGRETIGSQHRPARAEQDERWMRHAMALAARAEGWARSRSVPCWCWGTDLGRGWNRSISDHDACAHAEDHGAARGRQRLENTG